METKSIEKSKTVTRKVFETLRAIAALCIWIGLVLKLAFFDWDVLLVRASVPQYEYLLNYKIVAYFATISLSWLILGSKDFFWSLAYILFFPIFPVIHTTIYLFSRGIITSWYWVLLSVLGAVSFFKAFKFWFVSLSFTLTSIVAIQLTNNYIVNLIALTWFAMFALIICGRSVLILTRRNAMIKGFCKLVRRMCEKAGNPNKSKQKIDGAIGIDDRIKERLENLKLWIMLHGTLKWCGARLAKASETKLIALYSIFGLILDMAIVALMFGCMFFCWRNIAPESFNVEGRFHFLKVVLYGFANFINSQAFVVVMHDNVVRVLSFAENFISWFYGFVIVAMLASLYLSKPDEEIFSLAEYLERESLKALEMLKSGYNLTHEQALEEINAREPQLIAAFMIIDPDLKRFNKKNIPASNITKDVCLKGNKSQNSVVPDDTWHG